LKEQGFGKGNAYSNIYVKVDRRSILIIEIYVDEVIFGSDDDRMSKKFSQDMQNDFEMSLLGELTLFFGLHISQEDEGIFISQTKYIKEMLKKFRMEYCKPVSTLMVTGCKLRKDNEFREIDQRIYRSMISSLLYVITSIPNVIQEVGQVARFQATPKETHVLEIKRIFIYIKGTTEFGLWYPKGNEMTMVAYVDV